jgi:hypothetical protein
LKQLDNFIWRKTEKTPFATILLPNCSAGRRYAPSLPKMEAVPSGASKPSSPKTGRPHLLVDEILPDWEPVRYGLPLESRAHDATTAQTKNISIP